MNWSMTVGGRGGAGTPDIGTPDIGANVGKMRRRLCEELGKGVSGRGGKDIGSLRNRTEGCPFGVEWVWGRAG